MSIKMKFIFYLFIVLAFENPFVYSNTNDKKKVLVSIEDPPFLMVKSNENLIGNDRYYGYCVDLAEELSKIINITYEIRLVKDGKYGSKNESGQWNGMVGELVRNEADIVIAALTISLNRENVISYSRPFFTDGISLMIKKHKTLMANSILTFLKPFSIDVWICIFIALVGIIILLFIVSRLSPYEWYQSKGENGKNIKNDFSLSNSIWFCLAGIVQQGVVFVPKSCSARIIAYIWWFFALIILCNYIASLTAYSITTKSERLANPIESIEDLANQNEINYGTSTGGVMFFKSSKITLYKKLWESMSSKNYIFDTQQGIDKVRSSNGAFAFFLEASNNEYINLKAPCDTMKIGTNINSKNYGVATPKNSDLKDPINSAVQQLHENGTLEILRNKWWPARSECVESKIKFEYHVLNLSTLSGLFYILIFFSILSILILALEFVWFARNESKNSNVSYSDVIKSELSFDKKARRNNSNKNHELELNQ